MKMKVIKKFLHISFVAVLVASLIFGLTACGGNTNASSGANGGKLTAQACEECGGAIKSTSNAGR